MDRTGTRIGKGYRWISEDVLFGLDIYPTGLCISLTRIRTSETGLVFRLHVQHMSHSRTCHFSSNNLSHHKYMSCTPTVEIFYTWLSKIEHVRADRRYQQTSFSLQTLQARSSFQPILICPVYVSLYNNYTNTKQCPTINLHTTHHHTPPHNKNHMQANPTLKEHARNQKSTNKNYICRECMFLSQKHTSLKTKKLSLCAEKQISEGK
jgi:hypothetical protein